MGERQISVGMATYPLPRLFLVMATQNPLEHEGTYPLPEAQLDRFMLHTLVDYPDRATTRLIMDLTRREAQDGRELPAPTRTATSWPSGCAGVPVHARPSPSNAVLGRWRG